jgi:hypothetical protein
MKNLKRPPTILQKKLKGKTLNLEYGENMTCRSIFEADGGFICLYKFRIAVTTSRLIKCFEYEYSML